ncbi:MAG: MFS transporter [Lautropia sp.]
MLHLAGRAFAALALQMQVVAVGWQMYALTGSPLDLGLVGLVQFAPSPVLLFVSGAVLDRVDRRIVLIVFRTLEALACGGLAAAALHGASSREALFAAVFVIGVARAFEMPAGQAIVPRLVPRMLLSRAIATASSVQQVATIAGPALGGALYLGGAAAVYGVAALLFALSALVMLPVVERREAGSAVRMSAAYLFGGIAFIRSRPVLLGAISLDMVAVLFGGATALLPIYAKDILHTGPQGLGLLRAAPAVGALLMATWLARRPLRGRVGRTMLAGVAAFGVATLVFGVSTWLPLSLAALVVVGASDMISVVIRQSLVQLDTPDAMRGRVSAVNAVFIGASNQIGEFESGVAAAILGPVGSVVFGALGTLAVVAVWAKCFPALARRDRLVEQADAEAAGHGPPAR